MAYGREISTLSSLFSTIATEPKLQLLGGVVEDQLMTSKAMLKLSEQPPLQTMQQDLVKILHVGQQGLWHTISNTSKSLTMSLNLVSN